MKILIGLTQMRPSNQFVPSVNVMLFYFSCYNVIIYIYFVFTREKLFFVF